MTEICTIPELKILISQTEERIREQRIALQQNESLLKSLRQRLNSFVVDGLRIQVREFIEKARALSSARLELKRLEHLKWAKSDGEVLRKPYLHMSYSNLGYPCSYDMSVTEDEALLLSRQREAYNIDCSIWDTYRYPGELD